MRLMIAIPDVYFFPREGPLDEKFFEIRRRLHWHTAVVTYVVSGGLSRVPISPGQLRNLEQASAVYGNGKYLTQLVGKLGFPAETIYDGVDRRYYFPPERKSAASDKPLTVLFAGSFRSYKRADLVVKQAARWPQIQFRLAGRGEEEDECRRLASELGYKNVHFLEHLGQAELGNEMRRADIFLFPSELEGHPQVLLQAAGCGLPSIAMDSYHPDAIVNGETGFLVSSEDELAQKFDVLAQDATLRVSMSNAATAHAVGFDWDQVAAQWGRAFEKVTGERA